MIARLKCQVFLSPSCISICTIAILCGRKENNAAGLQNIAIDKCQLLDFSSSTRSQSIASISRQTFSQRLKRSDDIGGNEFIPNFKNTAWVVLLCWLEHTSICWNWNKTHTCNAISDLSLGHVDALFIIRSMLKRAASSQAQSLLPKRERVKISCFLFPVV